jgi:uncharacterized protein (TIGR02246 family)
MSDDEQAIRQWAQTWMAASKAGDTEAVLKMMSDDVIFMVPGRAPFGKKEFAESSRGMKDVRVDGTAEIVELQVLDNWAWLRSRLRIVITPANGQPMVRSGYTLTILRKDTEGKWLITRDANLLTESTSGLT